MPKLLPDIFSFNSSPPYFFPSTWIGLNLGGLRRGKIGRKMWLLPCRFRVGFNKDLKGYSQKRGSKKVAAKKYSIQKSIMHFQLSSKFWKYFMAHLPVLSENEPSVKWITDWPWKMFPQSIVSQTFLYGGCPKIIVHISSNTCLWKWKKNI
jgi:hypothetical protein